MEGGTQVYERVDRPLIPVVAMMERNGIKVDRAGLARLSEEFATRNGVSWKRAIHDLAGTEFTIGSPKQLGEVLFDTLGYKGGRKGKSGQYSTDLTVLEKLSNEGAPIASKVLEWRQLSKLKSTYTDALQAAINPDTGRVHTSYSLVGAQTGRLSSTDPNLQNIPIRTEIGRQIREAFVADEGNVLLAADYSQIELRLAAHMADVPSLKDAFAKGEDIHNRTAAELFGEVNRDTRGQAKTINFAILYGISRWGLAGRSGGGSRCGAGHDRPLFQTVSRHPEIHHGNHRIRAARTAIPKRCSGARRGSRASIRKTRTSGRAANAPPSTPRSRGPVRTSSNARWPG